MLSQSVDCKLLQTLSLCVSVCPAFTAYISLTMGQILIKLGENVGTSIVCIKISLRYATFALLWLCATGKARNGSKG